MGFAFSASGTVALSFGQTLLIGGASGIGTSFLNDVGDKYIKGDNISWGQIGFNALFSGVVSTAFAGIGFGLSKILGTVFKNSSFLSKGRELFRFGKTSNPDYGRITSYTTPNTSGVTLNFANNVGKSVFRIEFDSSMFLHYHFSSLLGTKAHIPLSPILDSSVSVNISKFFKEKFGEWFK